MKAGKLMSAKIYLEFLNLTRQIVICFLINLHILEMLFMNTLPPSNSAIKRNKITRP